VRLRDKGGNRFEVALDGRPLSTLVTASGRHSYSIASGLDPGAHELSLHRLTEAMFGETHFLGAILDDDGGALLSPPPPRDRRLELVGDSITCGYGADAADAYEPFTAETENHAASYGALTARALEAEAITVAWSGKGVYRNYDGGRRETMPELYDRILAERRDPRWDFAAWIPAAVIINLGTNDFAPGDPGPAFGDAYHAFLRRLRAQYPSAHLVCTLGPVMSRDQVGRARGYVLPSVEAARAAGDTRLSFLEFPIQDGSLGYGSDWHPSRATHRAMADRLTAELRRLLGW
jgi:lysophospholipase L1-like esterase